MIYRAGPPGSTRIVPLDSLTAIFHRASGQTHIVSEPAPQILAALSSSVRFPEPVEGLSSSSVGLENAVLRQAQGSGVTLKWIIDRLDLDDTAQTRALLNERLEELVLTGLVAQK